ncbi:unnamed protein product, partial [Polarella glacialis]
AVHLSTMGMDQATALLRQVCGKDVKVFNTLNAATAACEGATGKVWAVLPLSKSTLLEVHTALAQGSGQLGV